MSKYTIGLDFGTLSGRAVLVDISDGSIVLQKVKNYPHAVLETSLPDGTALEADFALAVPEDYRNVLDSIITDLVKESNVNPEDIIGIGLDVTSSTFIPIDENGSPLCEDEKFKSNPQAWMKMWKHHHAQPYADELTELMLKREESFSKRCGEKINAEWMMPKLLEIYREAPDVWDKTDNFMEAGDYLIYHISGKAVRSYTMLGYKMVMAEDGTPSEEFFKAVDEGFADVKTKLKGKVYKPGEAAAFLSPEKAKEYGLKAGIPIASSNIDAHVAFPALGITEAGKMLLILGTSCCAILMDKKEELVPGIFGVVKDGVLPGFYGYEAGQSAVGDIFEWFTENCVPASYERESEENGISIHELLTEKASKLKPGENGLVALDWWNGNRSILSDTKLSGMILGLTLKTKPEEIYRALLESVAYGLRKIAETFRESGIAVDEFYACGGISKKNRLMLQIYADINNCPIRIGLSDQCSALGSAIYAAAAAGKDAGAYSDVFEAAKAMGHTEKEPVLPNKENSDIYNKLYHEYELLHDYFGKGENDVMKRLLKIK